MEELVELLEVDTMLVLTPEELLLLLKLGIVPSV